MKCPYCTSQIDDEALACPHCARDLYLFKPLLAKIETLEQKLREMEARVAAVGDPAPQPAPAGAPEAPPTRGQLAAEAAFCWLGPLALLLLAHALIVVVYDLNTLYLRAVSLLIPLPFGLALMSRHRRHLGLWSAAAFAMALCAVLGMSWLTGLVDHTPVLPQDRREWREFIEYAISIFCSDLAGMVLGRMLWRKRQAELDLAHARGLVLKLAGMISSGQESAEKIQATVKKLQDIGSSLSAAGATAASVYMGLKGFIGD